MLRLLINYFEKLIIESIEYISNIFVKISFMSAWKLKGLSQSWSHRLRNIRYCGLQRSRPQSCDDNSFPFSQWMNEQSNDVEPTLPSGWNLVQVSDKLFGQQSCFALLWNLRITKLLFWFEIPALWVVRELWFRPCQGRLFLLVPDDTLLSFA